MAGARPWAAALALVLACLLAAVCEAAVPASVAALPRRLGDDGDTTAPPDDTTAPPKEEEEARHHKDEETTPPPEDLETTTPPPPEESVGGILWMCWQAEVRQLSEGSQWLNASLFGLVGIAMLWDAKQTFRAVVVLATFMLFNALAMSDISELWSLGSNSGIRQVVGIMVGLVGGYAAYVGIEGALVVVVAAFGCFLALGVQQFLGNHGVKAAWKDEWFIVILYSVFAGACLFIYSQNKHLKMLCIVSCAVGGALLSSALSWALCSWYLAGFTDVFTAMLHSPLTPRDAPWISFLGYLVTGKPKDVGLFADSAYNFQVGSASYQMDRTVGLFLWLLFFLLGVFVQIRYLRAADNRARTAHARESHEQPLLAAEHLL